MLDNTHSHTFETDKLVLGEWILDLGCRDFMFSKQMLSYGLKVSN